MYTVKDIRGEYHQIVAGECPDDFRYRHSGNQFVWLSVTEVMDAQLLVWILTRMRSDQPFCFEVGVDS